MNRRHALGALACAVTLPRLTTPLPAAAQSAETQPASSAAQALTEAWGLWKGSYLADDGRVVDELQEGASHSESQSYGLLLAATLRDEAAFDLIDSWTLRNLGIRDDRLLAWRWLPDVMPHVPDLNNASDGDLFYAWALIRGAEAFDRPQLKERAAAMARDLAASCVLESDGAARRLVFVPAADGFARESGNVINPSYYMPRAMEDIAEATGISAFAAAARDGMSIMSELSVQGLMPDWITLGPEGFFPDPELPDRNGYDAMRVPLFLIWSGLGNHPAVRRQAEALGMAAAAQVPTPVVMNRMTYAVQETSENPGYAALGGLVSCVASGLNGAAMPRFAADQPYYPATLHMFAMIAQIEASPSCVPI
ncbi:glycosyl hydrolase family 8 [Pseudoroseicyclus sp. CXY001]|uniref:glycosyl hydrolase family 8 n=1 Tax=Pseudoroseicyclus sp. CXY001 TaxID=3242492 RepID=UPI003570D609